MVEDKELSIEDVFNGLTEEQKNIVYNLAGWIINGTKLDHIGIDYYLKNFDPMQRKVVVAVLRQVETAWMAD